jgi:hypothetical protein
MLWKRKKDGSAATSDQPPKVKKVSRKDVAAQEIERIAPNEQAAYRLGKIFVKPYVIVVRNPEYPGKGKKFTVLQDGMDESGNPTNKPSKLWDTNDAKEIAGWILERDGTSMN